uniref:Uncharacterized protein n=1 Tax=Chromera velia CCMP2878 TaxID=1169474 RepID=A0A0G4F7P5_9ALVE|eukprot:Cvel_15646.t1-p1 / transcript=Cvel_15646.t1 / gene=Cvel_15646 / organism=Chromera_velia_CCMP2878 / gene_product=hypothetical protein / transcript_product=hypothetical protein / location=Cvel_scaffold1167:25621-28572(-) / protein_length=696 / sequence_SO=supercontig / SO=protein_coding / is_pseudo=false
MKCESGDVSSILFACVLDLFVFVCREEKHLSGREQKAYRASREEFWNNLSSLKKSSYEVINLDCELIGEEEESVAKKLADLIRKKDFSSKYSGKWVGYDPIGRGSTVHLCSGGGGTETETGEEKQLKEPRGYLFVDFGKSENATMKGVQVAFQIYSLEGEEQPAADLAFRELKTFLEICTKHWNDEGEQQFIFRNAVVRDFVLNSATGHYFSVDEEGNRTLQPRSLFSCLTRMKYAKKKRLDFEKKLRNSSWRNRFNWSHKKDIARKKQEKKSLKGGGFKVKKPLSQTMQPDGKQKTSRKGIPKPRPSPTPSNRGVAAGREFRLRVRKSPGELCLEPARSPLASSPRNKTKIRGMRKEKGQEKENAKKKKKKDSASSAASQSGRKGSKAFATVLQISATSAGGGRKVKKENQIPPHGTPTSVKPQQPQKSPKNGKQQIRLPSSIGHHPTPESRHFKQQQQSPFFPIFRKPKATDGANSNTARWSSGRGGKGLQGLTPRGSERAFPAIFIKNKPPHAPAYGQGPHPPFMPPNRSRPMPPPSPFYLPPEDPLAADTPGPYGCPWGDPSADYYQMFEGNPMEETPQAEFVPPVEEWTWEGVTYRQPTPEQIEALKREIFVPAKDGPPQWIMNRPTYSRGIGSFLREVFPNDRDVYRSALEEAPFERFDQDMDSLEFMRENAFRKRAELASWEEGCWTSA